MCSPQTSRCSFLSRTSSQEPGASQHEPGRRARRGEVTPLRFQASRTQSEHHSESGWHNVVATWSLFNSSSINRPRAGAPPRSARRPPSRGVSPLTRGCPSLSGPRGAQLFGSEPGQTPGDGLMAKVRHQLRREKAGRADRHPGPRTGFSSVMSGQGGRHGEGGPRVVVMVRGPQSWPAGIQPHLCQRPNMRREEVISLPVPRFPRLEKQHHQHPPL